MSRDVVIGVEGVSAGTERLDAKLITAGAVHIESALRETNVRAWLEVVWQFDDATHQHCLLVAGLAAGFAQHLGMSRADCERLTQAALLHDVGKSRIPLAILNKPSRLDEAKRAIMRTYPVIGYELLRGSDYPEALLAVVRSHHECLDGSGSPDRLYGRTVPDLVRVVTICDVYAALIERRPYREPISPGQAFATLAGMDGKLDIDLVRSFRTVAVAAGADNIRASV